MRFLWIPAFAGMTLGAFFHSLDTQSQGPVGPVGPTTENTSDENGSDDSPQKPKVDLPYKPKTPEGDSSMQKFFPTSEPVVNIPFIPSASPEPVGAPDPEI